MISNPGEKRLPYWLVNIPEADRPTECPDYLLNIGKRNEEILAVPKSEFHVLTWPEVQDLIKTNQLSKFQRAPLDHRKYLAYMAELKKKHGSVMEFVRNERLHWTSTVAKGPPFENPDDLKILYNDWPYGIDPKIKHLVVWTKFPLEDDPETDDLTPAMREKIDGYVEKVFRSMMPPENVIWFKNWSSLKSIHAMEHFHVMLNDPDLEFIRQITNGDVAVSTTLPANALI